MFRLDTGFHVKISLKSKKCCRKMSKQLTILRKSALLSELRDFCHIEKKRTKTFLEQSFLLIVREAMKNIKRSILVRVYP